MTLSQMRHVNQYTDTIHRYPGPTLRALELLQQERFRKDILIPETVARMVEEGFEASTAGLTR